MPPTQSSLNKMTILYTPKVSKATLAGVFKLLFQWGGSIYKIIWRQTLIFCFLFTSLQIIFRHCLSDEAKKGAWAFIKCADSVGKEIPYTFLVGFYVAFLALRWRTQLSTLPWPDTLCHKISYCVPGSDDRSQMIRRTLGRYACLLHIFTFQCISTSVKRRFPEVHHLVEAGFMTPDEMALYERSSFDYGKWSLPSVWFNALAVKARKEKKIKDSFMLIVLIEEMLKYRTTCDKIIIYYKWISVPLAYTQLVTVTAYFKILTLLLGKQTLDVPNKDDCGFAMDYYFPFVTIHTFLWSIGWLRIAEQLLNPYGDDDDDFELNLILDRSAKLAYLIVDHLTNPKLQKDDFRDVREINLPQTEHLAKYMKNPDLGPAFKLVNESQEDLEPTFVQDVLKPPIPDEACRDNSLENKVTVFKDERCSRQMDGTFDNRGSSKKWVNRLLNRKDAK